MIIGNVNVCWLNLCFALFILQMLCLWKTNSYYKIKNNKKKSHFITYTQFHTNTIDTITNFMILLIRLLHTSNQTYIIMISMPKVREREHKGKSQKQKHNYKLNNISQLSLFV